MSNAPVTINIAVDKAEVFRKVDRGTELRRLIEESENELKEIKAYLREAAKTGAFSATETGTVEIRSPETENCAQIIPQKDTPVLLKDVNMDVLSNLTQGEFDLTFRRVITMQPTDKFESAFAKLSKKTQAIIKKVVAWRPNEHQVRFSK